MLFVTIYLIDRVKKGGFNIKKDTKKIIVRSLIAISFILDIVLIFWTRTPSTDVYYFLLFVVVVAKDVTFYIMYRKTKNT